MIWTKPNGTDIETNDLKETVDYAKSLGWKPKRKRRTKEEMNGDRSASS